VIGPALAVTGGDLVIGFVLACVVALVVAGVSRWVRASKLIEAERLRPDPVEPVDLAAAIETYRIARDERLMGETRRAA
jgi:hypothetical protein